MISLTPESPEIRNLQPEKISAYLLNNGWRLLSHPNHNLRVFEGFADDFGQPIQLVLPKSLEFWDSLILIAKAMNLLAAIEERQVVNVLAAIRRNIRTKDLRSQKISDTEPDHLWVKELDKWAEKLLDEQDKWIEDEEREFSSTEKETLFK